ncbi:activator-dependent family glycosyltransferase [Amycolatopsis suaedae]|uniref:Activator-dependent family glycosyltransferase n=1 Tax=Amycolatopsis suaedae TaxID=2510978 RepID=A0A4Q7J2M0_9PSEU|nr:activator-dependent family glycosyltransferase [Amycolatopsis suaedae]RZQ61159.1 activator-dependent family glycosyltransferase [Amycolatopsis suaedae]
MRVLFATYPEKTLFQPMVPLAWALRTAGHEVRVASQPRFAGTITQAGLTAVPVGHDREFWRIMSSKPDRLAALRVGIMEPYDAFDNPDRDNWEYLKPGIAEAVWGWHRTSSFPMLGGLVEFARSWQPDLVIWDPLNYAGPIAAKACGAAHARLLWSVDVWGGVRDKYLRHLAAQPDSEKTDPFADWFGSYGRKYGFEFSEDMVTGNFTIDQIPPSLQIPADVHNVGMRFTPYGGAATVPDWLRRPAQRPRVALTMGVSATELFGGYSLPAGELLESLSELDAEIVAIVAESEQAKLGTLPDNVRMESYIPLLALAPTCSAAVHHAGFGTLTTFALHGVPQLALPYHFDEPIFAERLVGMGAGLQIHNDLATGPDVAAATRRLLTEPEFRRGAATLREEILRMPTANQLVPEVEQLVTKYRTR